MRRFVYPLRCHANLYFKLTTKRQNMQSHIGECDGGSDQWGHPSSPTVEQMVEAETGRGWEEKTAGESLRGYYRDSCQLSLLDETSWKSSCKSLKFSSTPGIRFALFIRYNSGRTTSETCQLESVFLASKMEKLCFSLQAWEETSGRATEGHSERGRELPVLLQSYRGCGWKNTHSVKKC